MASRTTAVDRRVPYVPERPRLLPDPSSTSADAGAMNVLHFSIDVPVEEQPPVAGGLAAGTPAPAQARLARGYVDLPGVPGRRVEVEIACGVEALEVSLRAYDEPAAKSYRIPFAWIMRRVALAHLAYREEASSGD